MLYAMILKITTTDEAKEPCDPNSNANYRIIRKIRHRLPEVIIKRNFR